MKRFSSTPVFGRRQVVAVDAVAAATERHTRVLMVNVWDLPAVYSWGAMNVAGVGEEWDQTAQRHFEAIADQWRHKYPDVEIDVEVRRGHAVEGIPCSLRVESRATARGRRSASSASGRRPARLGHQGVLQYATCPVVVHAPKDDD